MRIRLALVALLLIPAWCLAEAPSGPPLVDRVPGDALIYVGWVGSQSMGPAYGESNLKAVLDASAFPQLFSNFLPQLIQKAGQADPKVGEAMHLVLTVGGPLWRHPSAFYFGGVNFAGGPPLPRIALLCDAGTEADGLLANLNDLIIKAPPDAPPFVARKYGSLVVVSIGTATSVDGAFANPPANSLAKAATFTAALGQVRHDANTAAVTYVDVQGLVKLGDEAVRNANDPKATEQWPKIRDALGLTQFHQAVSSAGFDGKDWIRQAFVGTTGGNKGLAGFFSAGPLSADLLSVVPQSADRVVAGQFDLGALVREIRSGIGQFDPNLGDNFDSAITRINTFLGLDIQKDLLDQLGNEWVMYSSRDVGGSGLLGTVIVNKLKNAEKTDAALTQVAQHANDAIARQMRGSEMKVEFRQTTAGDLTIHYLAVPFVAPGWAIKDGNLYLGLYPQVISAAADQVTEKKPSILQNPQYLAVQKRLGDHKPTGVTFLNLPETAPEGYSGLLAISQMYLGVADMFGIHPPAMVLPPLNKITPYLAPSGGVEWSDQAGWHYTSITPFPGANVLGGGNFASAATIGETSFMISILLPSLNRARETANRVKCASNERQIGQAILLYANENKGNYPPDLGTLVKTEDIGPEVFICPSANTSLPPNIHAMTPDQQAAWVNEHSDYVYVGKGLKSDAPADRVTVYEKETDHGGDGMNMLYGDGHVEFQNAQAARREIEQLNDQGGGL
jgi:prepilin-type processing-associated H-X9-DG protein